MINCGHYVAIKNGYVSSTHCCHVVTSHESRQLSSLVVQDLQCLFTNEVTKCLAGHWVFSFGEVRTTGIEISGNAKARAIEFTQDKVALVVIYRHEVCSPDERQLRHVQVERLHDIGHGVQKHLFALLILRSIRRVKSLLVIAADTLRIFILFNPVQLSAHTQETVLPFRDSREVALVHHEPTCFHATSEILSCTL